jgi:hypothetical protein
MNVPLPESISQPPDVSDYSAVVQGGAATVL